MNELLNKIRKNKIKVTLDGDNLMVNLPEGFQNHQLLAEIKENKEEFIKYIKLIKDRKVSNTSGTERLLLLKEALDHKNNLFFFHDGSGNVNAYIELVDMIDSASCYGITYKANQFAPETVSLEELASYYIEEMKAVQNAQPYNLIGWSYGGMLCFEIAKQLQEKGEKVNSIVMIDTVYFPGRGPLHFNLEHEKGGIEFIFQENLNWINEADAIIPLWETAMQSSKMNDISLETIHKFIPEEIRPMLIEIRDKVETLRTYNVIRTLIYSLMNYTLDGAIDADVLYIKGKDSPNASPDFLNDHVNSLTVRESEGDHFSIMDKSNTTFLSQTIAHFFLSKEEENEQHSIKILTP